MADYRQFNPVPIICPHCHHIIGEHAYFESFEYKVAGWLNGQVAPSSTPGYDVWKCEPFPELTFQVKFATAFTYQSTHKVANDVSWSWIVKNPHPVAPDYFVLFGVHTDGKEYVFLYSREDFYKRSWRGKTGYHSIRASAKLSSDRKNYHYRPKIWKNYVLNPETRLIEAVNSYHHQISMNYPMSL